MAAMKKALITGVTGFVGSHLAASLEGRAEVWGIGIEMPGRSSAGRVLNFDLLDPQRTEEALRLSRPEVIYHLAAQSAPSLSLENPAETLKINIFTTLNLFEAASRVVPEAVIINVCSGDEYGVPDPASLPVKETAALMPVNPYAVSKVTTDLLGYQYWKAKGLKVIRCRPFNHFGPGQSDAFVCSAFARQIAEIESGVRKEKAMRVGNLDSSRDFLFVKDVIAAYLLLSEKGAPGEVYNICSGEAVRIRTIAETLRALSTERIEIIEASDRKRANDARIYGDPSKIKALGWSPLFSIKDGLTELLNHWRGKVRAGLERP